MGQWIIQIKKLQTFWKWYDVIELRKRKKKQTHFSLCKRMVIPSVRQNFPYNSILLKLHIYAKKWNTKYISTTRSERSREVLYIINYSCLYEFHYSNLIHLANPSSSCFFNSLSFYIPCLLKLFISQIFAHVRNIKLQAEWFPHRHHCQLII